MATNQSSCNQADEDYIDLEVSSSSNFFCKSKCSPPQTREFEFQMTTLLHEREPTTSPADELFYKGKLLPLHLPPRLQMVRKILQSSSTPIEHKTEEAFGKEYIIPFITGSNTPSISTGTPLECCNISPSESSRISSELNPDEYIFDWSIETRGFIGDHPKKFWSKKLKQFKQFPLGQKLKASRAYLKSLFSKSGCSDESCAKAASNVEAEIFSKEKDCPSKYFQVAKKTPFDKITDEKYPMATTLLKSIDREMLEEGFNNHRRSFSGVIQRQSANKSSSSSTSTSSSGSSSFSFGSNAFYDLQLLKRSCSANSEIESSIEGAIAYCKQSQRLFCSNDSSEAEVCSLFASRTTVCGDQERRRLCSI
ncbi:putative membrane-associated kinase regulator 4 [Morella rubra]|uniref:Putative membrane-associated kinase regulator 4 n=1 Tax=Morella rubra TaxID=262757 RepID=A0A6A1W8P2_9ROSI|nr:putative membrane-associated kinase regulator 4 [Morella rubra]KAB1221612.1 putative membrane-associated kinase regulator 4 [Morella rubra]